MPDLSLRLGNEILTLSSDLTARFIRDGYTDVCLSELAIFESDTTEEMLRVEKHAGAQAIVTNTRDITRARLAHFGLESKQSDLARANMDLVRALKPQHLIAEIGPTLLPIDPDSASSLKSNRNQYKDAITAFGAEAFGDGSTDEVITSAMSSAPEALLFSDMQSLADTRCALMAKAMCSDIPAIPLMHLCDDLTVGEDKKDVRYFAETAQELEAAGVGISISSAGTMENTLNLCVEVFGSLTSELSVPLMIQIDMSPAPAKTFGVHVQPALSTVDDLMRVLEATLIFKPALLRVGGSSKPTYTGALAAHCLGMRLDG